MFERRSLVLLVAIPVLMVIILAGSSFFARPPRDPILITEGMTTPTGMNPAFSPTPSPVFASTSTRPSFTLMGDSNCYTGPGAGYDVVLNLQAGTTLDVIGRSLDNTWWRVAQGPSIDCWIPSDVGAFSGDAASIPITSSRYATQALTPPTPTKEKRTAEPTSAGGPAQATPAPTNAPAQPTDTSPPVANTPPPVINTLPPIINTVVPPTSVLPPPTEAPTEAPPPGQPQPQPPGLFHRPATATPEAPTGNTATEPPVATP